MSDLALYGGAPVIKRPFPPSNTIGDEELAAARKVIESGLLSGFFGSHSQRFFGGPKVRELEQRWAELFEVGHAVSFNSWTSGLIAAVGAVGVEPGDEVIVSPWTMTASATAILIWHAIPVFADIEDRSFNLDPASVERNITPRTSAIMVPDIFGHPARLDEIMAIAEKHGLKVIEDAAQAPLVRYRERYAGAVAQVGGYSLNYHKHIHTGEGGIAVTDSEELALRMQLIRNHGEAVVGPMGLENIANIIGFNFRMGELEAAIALAQLRKLPELVARRNRSGELLCQGLRGLPGLRPPVVEPDCGHAFYILAMVLDQEVTGVPRDLLVAALQAEGVPWVYPGYQLLHLQPIYQRRIAYGSKGFPWTGGIYDGEVSYRKGICPVAERLHEQSLVCLQICQHDYDQGQIDLVLSAFHKVWEHLPELARRGKEK